MIGSIVSESVDCFTGICLFMKVPCPHHWFLLVNENTGEWVLHLHIARHWKAAVLADGNKRTYSLKWKWEEWSAHCGRGGKSKREFYNILHSMTRKNPSLTHMSQWTIPVTHYHSWPAMTMIVMIMLLLLLLMMMMMTIVMELMRAM